VTAQKWPVAYRNGASLGTGFQSSPYRSEVIRQASDVRQFREMLRRTPLRAAAERKLSMPYFMKPKPPAFGVRPRDLIPLRTFAPMLKPMPMWLLRLNPWIRAAWALWEIYQWYQRTYGTPMPNLLQYEVIRDCGRTHAQYLPGDWVCGASPGVWTDGGFPMPVMTENPLTFSSVTQPTYFPGSGTTRWTNNISYKRLITEPVGVPLVTPRWDRIEWGSPRSPAGYWPRLNDVIAGIPLLDPLKAPSQDPLAPPETVAPTPIPYRVLPYRIRHPRRSPTESTDRGYDYPGFPPGEVDKTKQTIIKVGPKTKTKTEREVPIRHKPPGIRVKERKVRVGTVNDVPWLAWIANAITESTDVVNAIFDAIPLKDRWLVGKKGFGRYYGPMKVTDKLKVIYREADKIDIEKAFKNLMKNQAEDAIIGRLSQGGKDLAIYTGRPIGYGTGPAI
jgi:hypothetical protein